jgi:hypothetical protein
MRIRKPTARSWSRGLASGGLSVLSLSPPASTKPPSPARTVSRRRIRGTILLSVVSTTCRLSIYGYRIVTDSWHLFPDCGFESAVGWICPACLHACRARAESVRQRVREERELRAADRRQRLRSARDRQRERIVWALYADSDASSSGRSFIDAACPVLASSADDAEWLSPLTPGGRARTGWFSAVPASDTRLYVWGYGPPQSRLLCGPARSTPEAREFAVERGWDEERSGAWAIELALPVPLSAALDALEPAIRADRSVAGYGGRSMRPASSGARWPLTASQFGLGAGHSADPIPSTLPPRLDGRATGARIEGVEPGDGQAVLSHWEFLRERVSAVLAQSRSLCHSAATAVEQTRTLRLQLAGSGREENQAVADTASFLEVRSAGHQRPIGGRPCGADVSLPDTEFAALNEVVTHAHDLAAEGRLSAGYGVLLAGRRRAENAAAGGVDWAPDLVRIYNLALENYIWRYGVKL